MKSTLIIILSIIGLAPVCIGQNNSTEHHSTLYIIKYGSKEIRTTHLLISPFDVENMDLPSKGAAVKSFGAINEDVVIVITPKDDVKLLTLPLLYDKYRIDMKFRMLAVNIDGESVLNPNDLIVDTNDINSVSIDPKKNTINIVTNKKARIRTDSKNKKLRLFKINPNKQ